jgi:ribosomal protein L40E
MDNEKRVSFFSEKGVGAWFSFVNKVRVHKREVASNMKGEKMDVENSKICVKCGHYIEKAANFCSECGSNQDALRTCRKCSSKIAPDAKFCSKCGGTADTTVQPHVDVISPATQVPTTTSQEKKKPRMPGSIIGGIILFVISFFIELASGTDPAVEARIRSMPEESAAVLGLIVLGFALLQTIWLIFACKGYSWGASLVIITNIFGYLIVMGANIYSFSFGDILNLAYIVCLILPVSWEYYAACAEYRQHRKIV